MRSGNCKPVFACDRMIPLPPGIPPAGKAAAASEALPMGPYNITAYLAAMGISTVCASVLFYFSLRKSPDLRQEKALPLTVCVLLLGAVLGILFAKLFYFLFYFFYLTEQGAGTFWFSLKTEELSYYGGVAGVCLAVALSAKIFGMKPVKVLNAFAPACALLAAAARFAEYFLYPTGTGSYLETPLFFPLAVNIVWSEDYTSSVLAVYMYEGVMSLVAFVLCLKHRGEPRRMLRTLFYLCLPQILLESLRADAISLLFVHMEQLLCYLFVEGVLIWYGWKGGRKHFASWIPALTGLLVCGLTIVEEFMLDGKIRIGGSYVSPWITYTLMAAGLALLAVMEHRGNRRLYSLSSK